MSELIAQLIDICNKNSGFLSLLLFFLSLAIAFFSGFFRYINRKPRLIAEVIEGPTFYTEAPHHREENGKIYRTHCFALYLRVSNIGNAPTTLTRLKLRYLWKPGPFGKWVTIDHSTTSLSEFKHPIGCDIKIYPYLIQKMDLADRPDHYITEGKSISGVIYFESEFWGNCVPYSSKEITTVQILLLDTLGKSHNINVKVPIKEFNDVSKYNDSLGQSLLKDRESHID